MDFMKIFDQTVRDIKREVNLKVLKIPEIEQKVLDATDGEPWGPHGTVLTEIAQATKKYTEGQMVLNVLWARLEESGKNWRLVYKALSVIEFLVGHGSDRAVDDIIEHTFQIAALTTFEYVEPNGKDVGLNVRKKADTIASLLNDKEKIQVVRTKAAANRDKYVGLSSKGTSFRSLPTSYGSSGYGSYRDREKDSDFYVKKSDSEQSKDSPRFGRKSETAKKSSVSVTATVDEFEDFNPRATSSKAASKPSNNGQSLLVDLTYVPASANAGVASSNVEVDLFADAAFASAQAPPVSVAHNQQVDLFGDLNSSVDEISSNTSPNKSSPVDLFSSDIPQTSAHLVSSKASSQNVPVDLFSSNISFQNASADLFSSNISHPSRSADIFSSNISPQNAPTVSLSSNISPNSPADLFASNITPVETFATNPLASFSKNPGASDVFGAFNSAPKTEETNTKASFSNPTMEKFGVKSGIWADSLSRGLIDLNITAPKVSAVNVEAVKEMNDVKPTMAGRSNSTTGHKVNPPTFTQPIIDDDFFSSLASSSQYHFGQFQK